MNNYSGAGSSVQSTSSAQGGGPDFGDLLHAYDVSAEGDQDDTHDVPEPSETLCGSTTAPEENPSSLEPTEPCSLPGNAENMSCHSTVSPANGSLDNRPTSNTMPATTHSVTQADTSAANSSTQGTNQNAQQTTPLSIDTSQESSLQTLSRFVEELSSPKLKVTFNSTPADENEAEASSSVKLVWQVGNRGESASEKVSSASSEDVVSCSREGSILETCVPRDGDVSALDGCRRETPVLESDTSAEQTSGVSSNVSDGQSETLVGALPLSASMSVTTTGEECVNTTSLNKFGIASRTELSVDSELSKLFGKAVTAPTVSSEQSSSNSGLIEDSLSSESVLMDTHNFVSSSNINTASNSSLSNSVADSSSQNSLTFNKENSQDVNVLLSSGNGDPIISSVTNSNECSNSSRGGPSPAEVVSVLVTDSHLQTVHCMGGSQTEMLSFNIENVPDSSINDSESCVTERCPTGENNVTSSSPGIEYTHRGSESVNTSVNRSQENSKSAFTLEAEKETVCITSSNSEKGQNGDGNEMVSTSCANVKKITPEGDKQKQVKRSVAEISDDALEKGQQELGVSSKACNLLEDSPVLMQCLGVDHPVVKSGVSKATASSSVQMENESITSSSTSATASEMLAASSNGQPFTVTPSSTDRPFVITPIGEPVLSPNSIQSSNPSPVGSASSNQATHSPPATASSTKSSASTGRENKRKKKNPMRSQNYNTVSDVVPAQPSADHAHVVEHSFPQSIPDSAALPVQIKHEKPDGEWSGNTAPNVLNIAPPVAHVPQDTLLPRITSVQSLHPGVVPLNILPQQPPTAPKPPRARNSKARSSTKSINKDSQSITSGPSQPNFSASQNLYNASNLMNHLNERAGMRNTGRPLGNYYPPINITPDNAPSGPPPPQSYPPPYMSHGPMRMTMPYMPPPPPPHFGNRPNMQVDRSAVHLDRGNFRMERPPATHLNRPGINLEQRHNMLQTTRPPFSSPFIDMGPQLGDIYYSQPPGMMIPPPRPLPQQPQQSQHHPLRAPLVIRPDCPPQLNFQTQFRTSPDSSGAAAQSLTKRFTAPTSSVGNAAQQPSKNRNTFVSPEAMKGKNGAMVFVPPRVISEASKTSISNTTSVSKTSTLGRTVKIVPKKPPTTVSSVIVKASVASSPISSAMKSANADPDPNRISSDILKEQKVKTYKPGLPPEHLGFKDTLKTCKCQGCGDEFLFASSLVNHLDRKSIMIKYNCGECNKNIVFYNRCCLFIHAKGHAKGLKAYRLNINLATINVLPDDLLPSKETMMHVEPETNIQKDKEKTVNDESTCTSVVGIKSPVQIVSSMKTPEKILPKPTDLKVATSYTDYNPNYVTVSKHDKRMYKCVECKKLFPNVRLLQSHFSGKTTKTIGLYKCSKCLTNVIGTCASTAHMRIHSKEQPFVCPECGELITGNRDIFLKHLKQKCMHFQRTLLLKCKLCSSILLYDAETVATHYNEQHSMKYYKCLECPMAFKSEAPYKAHLATEHNSRGVHKLICKCPLCDTVFHQVCNIESHFRNDHWPSLAQDVFTAYKCLACVPKKVFNQRNAYIVHSVRAHGNTTVTEMCNECGKEFPNVDEMKLHRKLVHKDFEKVDDIIDEHTSSLSDAVNGDPKGLGKGVFISLNDLVNATEKPKSTGDIACEKCEMTFSDSKTYEKHMEKHKFVEKRKLIGTRVPSVKVKKLKIHQDEKSVTLSTKSSKVEKESQAQNQTEKEGSKSPKAAVEFHGQVPTAPTPKPRNKCSECPARYSSADELQEHLKIAHGMSPQYPCHLCGNTYESQTLIERHIQVAHEGKSKDHPYFCWLCLETNIIKGYSNWKMLEKHLTGHHKLHKNNIDYSKFPKDVKEEVGDAESVSSRRSSLELDDTPVKRLKVAGDSLFNCAKCSFQADVRDEFVQHITKHKPDDFSLQCLDCGLCFAVLPSLKRHLFAVHKVRDFAQYQEESGMDVEQANVDGSGLYSPQTSPLKLHVSQIPNGIAQPNLEKLEKKNETKKVEAVAEEPTLECNVCYKTFDDDAARRKHMRMHGMAFIRSRRAAVPAWE